MSTTAQINAYLEWRAKREGKQVNVSPDAYERDRIIREIFGLLDEHDLYSTEQQIIPIGLMKSLVDEYRNLEEDN